MKIFSQFPKISLIILLSGLLAFLNFLILPIGVSRAETSFNIQGEYAPGELLIKFQSNPQNPILVQDNRVNIASVDELNKKFNLQEIKKVFNTQSGQTSERLTNVYHLKFSPNQDLVGLISEYQKNPYVEYAEPNYIFRTTMTPNDTLFSLQWHFHNTSAYNSDINMPAAWDYDTTTPKYGGDSSVVVAVIDTGVAYENYSVYSRASDLAQTTFVAGYDYVNNDSHPNDDNGHGTHVTGTIAQSTNNSIGVAGMAFNSSIMPLKALDDSGNGYLSDVAQAVTFAKDNGADVISMSLSGGDSTTLHNAITEAYDAGVIVVAATGNDSVSSISYPARYDEVIAVGATRYDAALAPYSNWGTGIDLVAPGGDTSVDQNSDGYADGVLQQTFTEECLGFPVTDYSDFVYCFLQGTSMATPHVAGAAALLLAYGASSSSVKNFLESTAQDLGSSGYDTIFGYGLLDVEAALSLVASDNTAPTGTISINSDDDYTNDNSVTLALSATDTGGSGLSQMAFSNDNSLYSAWEDYATTKTWDLTDTTYGGSETEESKTVYVKYIDGAGNPGTFSDTIVYDVTTPSVPSEVTAYDSEAKVYSKASNFKSHFSQPYFEWSGSSDSLSGIKGYYVYFGTSSTANPATEGTFQTTSNYQTSNLTDGQTYYLIIKTSDRADNVSSDSASFIYPYSRLSIVTGVGNGGGPQVRVFDREGTVQSQFFAYGTTFRGGVNVTTGDLDGDGQDEIVTGTGVGGGPQVRVFDLQGNPEFTPGFFAYGTDFRGGVQVATGDLDGDGKAEIITGVGNGGGPQVRVFDRYGNIKFTPGFFAYGTNFRGGVLVASGDLDGDGQAEIVTGTGNGGGPQVRVFDRYGNIKFTPGFFAYGTNFRGGVLVSTGDLDGDGKAEIITGTGVGGGPQVRIFDRYGNLKFTPGFFAYGTSFRGGVNVATGDLDGDSKAEIITGAGNGGGPQVRVFDRYGNVKLTNGFFAYATTFRGGVLVASGRVK